MSESESERDQGIPYELMEKVAGVCERWHRMATTDATCMGRVFAVVDERDKLLADNGRLRAVVTETLDLMRLRAEGRPVSIGEAHILVANCRGALEVPSE